MTRHTRHTCPRCGTTHQGGNDECWNCRCWQRYVHEATDALPPGRWVLCGAIRVYMASPTVPLPRSQHAPAPPKWAVAPCGTVSAYRRHLRLRTPTCDACRAAQAARRKADRVKVRVAQYDRMTPFQRLAVENVRYGPRREVA